MVKPLFYELTFLARPGLAENELKGFLEEIQGLISSQGKIFKQEAVKKINLSYPIAKNKEAFLMSFSFQTETALTSALKNELDKKTNILRFLLIKKSLFKEKQEALAETQPEKPEKKRVKTEGKKEKLLKAKVEIADIEKELERMLDFHNEDKPTAQSDL